MKLFLKPLFTIAVFLFVINHSFAQAIDSVTAKKIDGFFKQYDNPKSPGCAIGIIRNDSLIYAKGYGMANLETGSPITAETIFEMGSTSKQFTAFAIVLLARQGKLSLNDDIHKYLTWFPYLEGKITIRNLLNHTSGLRNINQLLAIQGTRQEDVITRDHIINILSRQQSLNFIPGTEYMYNNTGFFLAGEVVRAVTGKSLRQFTDSAIFEPLGMNSTHIHDDYNEMVPNRAYPYGRDNHNQFANSAINWAIPGATGVYTNVNDMSKWLADFYSHKRIMPGDLEQLTKKLTLPNGKQLDYGMGMQLGPYRGKARYAHSGINSGFFTYVMYLPELKMGFIVLSNLSGFPIITMAEKMADLYINEPLVKDVQNKSTRGKPDNANIENSQSIKPFIGSYVAEDGDTISIKLEGKKIYFCNYDGKNLLIKASKDTMVLFYHPGVKLFFGGTNARHAVVKQIWHDHVGVQINTYKKYDATQKLTDKELLSYSGTYFCPELECIYSIKLQDHQLVLVNAKYGDTRLKLYGKDQLTNDFNGMHNLNIVRSKSGRITGFEVSFGGIQDLWFKKMK